LSGGLRLLTTIALPPGEPGGFDHGDVDPITGRVFVAHTGFDTIEVIDYKTLNLAGRIDGCPEGSGVLFAGGRRMVFAAARGAGQVLVVDTDRLEVTHKIAVGPRPNGLAWDETRGHLLVADVDAADQRARLIEVPTGRLVSSTSLPGRPRWCVFDQSSDHFLINIREPASVAVLAGENANLLESWSVGSRGPHGLDLDRERRLAFVACDGAEVIAIDIRNGRETGRTPISGEPDAIWFNRQRRTLYVAVGDPGVIDVIDTERMTLVETVATDIGAHTTAFDQGRQRLYVFLPERCVAAVYEVT
jgi:DNA-binding beta-propeller fold protein YncE